MNNVVGLQNILFLDGSGHNAPSIITALTEVIMFNISKANVYASVIGQYTTHAIFFCIFLDSVRDISYCLRQFSDHNDTRRTFPDVSCGILRFYLVFCT